MKKSISPVPVTLVRRCDCGGCQRLLNPKENWVSHGRWLCLDCNVEVELDPVGLFTSFRDVHGWLLFVGGEQEL